MKVVYICIGSACHLKGSQQVIECFKSLIKTYELEDKLELKAAFCIGHCVEAVTIQKWDGTILSVHKDTVDEVFRREILPYL